MYSKSFKNKVIKTRKSGVSIGDLANKYSISKSTISIWCKDLGIDIEAKEKIKKKWLINTNSGRRAGVEANKVKRINSIQNEFNIAKKDIDIVTARDVLVSAVALYWAEGSKKETGSGFNFINSDPKMVLFIYKWLLYYMLIPKDNIKIILVINSIHNEREQKILKFWSNLLDYSLYRFGKTVFIKNKNIKIYKNNDNYYGMIRIRVSSSSWLRRRISGMIEALVENMPM